MRHIFTLLLAIFSNLCLQAQPRIAGMVTDKRGEGLPFVHIIVNDQKDRVFSTELSGHFELPYSPDIRSLTFSYVGYALQKVDINGLPATPLRVVLQEEPYTLAEAVVIAGENPAHRIIHQALKNRDRHNPEKLTGYQYQAFTKVTLKLLPNWETIARRESAGRRPSYDDIPPTPSARASRLDSMHIFVMETLSQHAWKQPDKKREEIIRHRTSGFQQPWFTGLVSQLQPFAFYRDELPFLEKRYLNPISPGSTTRYRFRLEDTLFDGPDSIFVISFRPMPGTTFIGLKGVLHIHSAGYAIQHLLAESAEPEQIQFHIDQKYVRVQGGYWFPAQLSLVLQAEKYPSPEAGIQVASRTYLDSVHIAPAFEKGFFALKNAWLTAPEANRRDSLLPLARKEPLSHADSISFAFIDSLGQAINLDQKMRTFEALAEGALPIGKVDWVFSDLFRFSQFEGFAPGLGLRTGRSLSKAVQLYGWGGYAFRARAWRYGGALSIFPSARNRNNSLVLQYRNDLVEPATAEFPVRAILVNRRYFARRMDRQYLWSGHFTWKPSRALWLQGGLQRQQQRPLYDYTYQPGADTAPSNWFTFTEASLHLRYTYRIQSIRLLGTDTEVQSRFPILYLSAARGIQGLWGGQYDYWRLHGALQYTAHHRRWGATHLLAEGGWLSAQAPLAKLFTPVGTGAGVNAVSLRWAFETMWQYEFVSDRYVHLYLEHVFPRLTRRSAAFQPQPALIHRMGWGELTNETAHQGFSFQVMRSGYFESGFAVYSLLRYNYLNIGYISLGAKVLYRYGPYGLDRWQDSTAIRLIMQISR